MTPDFQAIRQKLQTALARLEGASIASNSMDSWVYIDKDEEPNSPLKVVCGEHGRACIDGSLHWQTAQLLDVVFRHRQEIVKALEVASAQAQPDTAETVRLPGIESVAAAVVAMNQDPIRTFALSICEAVGLMAHDVDWKKEFNRSRGVEASRLEFFGVTVGAVEQTPPGSKIGWNAFAWPHNNDSPSMPFGFPQTSTLHTEDEAKAWVLKTLREIQRKREAVT